METRLVNPYDCQYIQSRVALDADTVQQYADMLRQEIVFDACKGVINSVTGAIIIYDGNHRAEAAKREGVFVQVELEDGNASYAEWLATGANTRHGLKRTPADIEHAVTTALRHPRSLNKSDREIARHCGCDHKTVGKYRKELEASGDIPQMPTRTVQRNGAEYQMTIPMPQEPEPASTRNPSPMVFDAHMRPAPKKPQAKASDADMQMVIKDWLFVEHDFDVDSAQKELTEAIYEPIYKAERFNRLAQYVELRLVCTRSDIRQACKLLIEHTEAQQPGNAHQPEPEPTPRCHRVRCLDCGEEIPLPDDRDALHLCPECQDARRREQERLIEVHRRQGLIPTPEPEIPDNDGEHERTVLRTCSFCGEKFKMPEGLYVSHQPFSISGICAQCVMKAAREITRYKDIAKPYCCPDCGYKFQAVAVKFYADDDTSGIDLS